MEERLPIGRKHFVAVFIDTLSKLFPAPQYARQDRIAATRGIEPDGVKHGGFTDTVLSGNQCYAAQPRNRKVPDSAKSSDRQAGKVEICV